MRSRSVRLAVAVVALLAPLPLLGCGPMGGLDSAVPVAATPTSAVGGTWTVVQAGAAPSSPTPAAVSSPVSPPALLAVTASPDPNCPVGASVGSVLLPVAVTVGAGSVTATWPRQGTSAYRVAAVPQKLVSGTQPSTVWQPVAAGTRCTVSATISGLRAGEPYVVWLDAKDPGKQPDGTPNPDHGRSDIFYPR